MTFKLFWLRGNLFFVVQLSVMKSLHPGSLSPNHRSCLCFCFVWEKSVHFSISGRCVVCLQQRCVHQIASILLWRQVSTEPEECPGKYAWVRSVVWPTVDGSMPARVTELNTIWFHLPSPHVTYHRNIVILWSLNATPYLYTQGCSSSLALLCPC